MNWSNTHYLAFIGLLLVMNINSVHGQVHIDSATHSLKKTRPDSTIVILENGNILVYKKPKAFSFITQVPRTIGLSAQMTFRKKSIPAIVTITGLSLALISSDQSITNGVQHFGRYIGVDATRNYGASLDIKLGGQKFTVYDVPKNFNTVVYSLGEGLASVALSGVLLGVGKVNRDYRMIQTSSQIVQVQLAVGVIAQSIKRISGRESPFQATAPGGVWRPLPTFSVFQHQTSKYDAFPSGHLATLAATFTVLTMNYPEKRWIKWVGGGVMSLVGLSMINNGVHWAGDYPLALGIGYVTGYATVKLNRLVYRR